MNVSGSGVGPSDVNIGNPNMQSQVEKDTTPVNLINQALLAIVQDSIKLFVTDIGKDQLWKYQSSSSQPTLPHPLEVARIVGNTISDIQNKAWEKYYENLKELNELAVKDRLQRELKKPAEERNTAYVAFDNVMIAAAKTLAWIDSVKLPVNPNNPEGRASVVNQSLSQVLTLNLGEVGENFVKEAHEFLDQVGSNHQNFDKLTNLLNQTESALNKVNQLSKRGS